MTAMGPETNMSLSQGLLNLCWRIMGFLQERPFFRRHSLLTPEQLDHLTSSEDVRTLDLRAAELAEEFHGRFRGAFRGVYETILTRFIRDYYLRRDQANARAATWPH